MKKIALLLSLLGMICIAAVSCTTDAITPFNTENIQQDRDRTEQDALCLTNQLLGVQQGRNSSNDVEITPILRTPLTRSIAHPDTIAYVINRLDEKGGFSVISKSQFAPAVLAFADTGRFDLETQNEIVREQFTDFLPDYIAYHEQLGTSSSYLDPSNLIDIDPIIRGESWWQIAPYDKYVIQEHPGCPVGCIPLACVRAMIFAKDKVTLPVDDYRQELFDLKEIRSSMEEYELYTFIGCDGDSIDEYWIKSRYADAQDRIAKLLYLFGKMCRATYTTSGTGVSNAMALTRMSILNFTCIPDVGLKFLDYDFVDIISHLKNNCIIIMGGTDVSLGADSEVGHAWVVDGAVYHKMIFYPISSLGGREDEILAMSYLHCDWGWGGDCNGYYNGDIFNVQSKYASDFHCSYGKLQYFAVKKD